MSKLATFFRTWVKSLTEPAYYNDIVRAKFSYSLKYYLFFYFVLSLILSILFQLRTIPYLQEIAEDTVHELTTGYPADLKITFETGRMSLSGAQEPLQVPFPQSLEAQETNLPYDYLFTFDTQAEVADPDSMITFTETEMIVRQIDGRKQSFPLTDITESFTVDRNTIQMFTSLSRSYIDRIIRVLPFFLFAFLIILLPAAGLILLTIYSLFTMAVANLIGKSLSYKKSFQIGLHTITFAETVRFLQDQLFSGVDISYFFSLAFFGATLIAIFNLKSSAKPIKA